MVSTLKLLETTTNAWSKSATVYDVISPLCNLAKGSLWREFSAGIRLLRSHVGHFSADLSPVARSNLRLLHQEFNKSRLYRESLLSLRKSTQINWRPISREQSLICGILHIPAGMSLDLVHSADPERIHAIPELVHPNSLCMMYVISGKMNLLSDQPAYKFLPHRFWHYSYQRNCLKMGAARVIIPTGSAHSQLCVAQQDTQLLMVSYANP